MLFHHAQGQTAGFTAFADELRSAGHLVHAPDLYDGHTFGALDDGVRYADQLGDDEILRRAAAAAGRLAAGMVYAGFSLGTFPAQYLTQTRPGARGALLFHGGFPVTEFASPWPQGVPLQMHSTGADPWVDIDVLRGLSREVAGAELFLYPGSAHLFADRSLGDYDEAAARLLIQRVLSFLGQLG